MTLTSCIPLEFAFITRIVSTQCKYNTKFNFTIFTLSYSKFTLCSNRIYGINGEIKKALILGDLDHS